MSLLPPVPDALKTPKTDLDRFKQLYDSLDIKYLIRNESGYHRNGHW